MLQPIIPLYAHPCWPHPAPSRCRQPHISSSPPPTHSHALPIPPPAAVTAQGNKRQTKQWNDGAETKQEDREGQKGTRGVQMERGEMSRMAEQSLAIIKISSLCVCVQHPT